MSTRRNTGNINPRSRQRLEKAALTKIAMAMALPHENRPVRFPVTPVVHTALLDLMSETTYSVGDAANKRAVLTRDVAYPLWIEKSIDKAGVYLSNVIANVASPAGTPIISTSRWDSLTGWADATTKIDGAVVSVASLIDSVAVLSSTPFGTEALYVPPGSQLSIQLTAPSNISANKLQADVKYYNLGEWKSATLDLNALGTNAGWLFQGTAGTSTVTTGAGFDMDSIVPYGFVVLTALRVKNDAAASVQTNPSLFMGWASAGSASSPIAGPTTLMVPAFPPAEFGTSTIPYKRTRCTASASLFTNVGAELYQEGTVLASRLKSATVDFFDFTAANINSVHPRFRYYGPLHKGLYTFTTPSSLDTKLQDAVIRMTNQGSRNTSFMPAFNYEDVGVYNAIIFTDLGSGTGATQLAVSLFNHLEFEAVSSLFSPGVSHNTLETLHAAEVALVDFGHFHENPLHWAALTAAAKKALAIVGPMVAPIVQHYGGQLLQRGVKYLAGPSKPKPKPQAPKPKMKTTKGKPRRK